MSSLSFALSIGAAAALLASCGGQVTDTLTSATRADLNVLPHQKTFHYTGTRQAFIVPALVSQITVVARGAGGGGSLSGRGGRVSAIIPVTQGQKLFVYVGGTATGITGGFNGGAAGGNYYSVSGSGGGGASDVRQGGFALADRILIVGGGGGTGDPGYHDLDSGRGGRGGGSVGGSGSPGCDYSQCFYAGDGGTGGTQYSGGSGGMGGTGPLGEGNSGGNGALGAGGVGGARCEGTSCFTAGGSGGGGGGGYYGGGGGGAGGGGSGSVEGGGGGGGGGSSFIEPGAKHARMWQGWHKASGNGLIVFSW